MLRTFFLSGRTLRASAAVAAAVSGVGFVSCNASGSDGAMKKNLAKVDMTAEQKAANDLMWEETAKHCAFCGLMLGSPCSEEFKLFFECSERARENGQNVVEVCGPTDEVMNLRQCQVKNSDYFAALMEKFEIEEDEEHHEKD